MIMVSYKLYSILANARFKFIKPKPKWLQIYNLFQGYQHVKNKNNEQKSATLESGYMGKSGTYWMIQICLLRTETQRL